jgi:hypothetical protein
VSSYKEVLGLEGVRVMEGAMDLLDVGIGQVHQGLDPGQGVVLVER